MFISKRGPRGFWSQVDQMFLEGAINIQVSFHISACRLTIQTLMISEITLGIHNINVKSLSIAL